MDAAGAAAIGAIAIGAIAMAPLAARGAFRTMSQFAACYMWLQYAAMPEWYN